MFPATWAIRYTPKKLIDTRLLTAKMRARLTKLRLHYRHPGLNLGPDLTLGKDARGFEIRWTPNDGNIYCCGRVGSGKTHLLRTFATQINNKYRTWIFSPRDILDYPQGSEWADSITKIPGASELHTCLSEIRASINAREVPMDPVKHEPWFLFLDDLDLLIRAESPLFTAHHQPAANRQLSAKLLDDLAYIALRGPNVSIFTIVTTTRPDGVPHQIMASSFPTRILLAPHRASAMVFQYLFNTTTKRDRKSR
ncbi:MAG: ATP-binding protein [Renibacterium salmoninarum]|jgi:hypothetical protein|nr:ATP-binding protein [Renibacterium salmoninarum]